MSRNNQQHKGLNPRFDRRSRGAGDKDELIDSGDRRIASRLESARGGRARACEFDSWSQASVADARSGIARAGTRPDKDCCAGAWAGGNAAGDGDDDTDAGLGTKLLLELAAG